MFFFFQAEDGIRDPEMSRGLGDVYKRQGIGREMHEDPCIPNYGRRGNGIMLKDGMCIAIEPMVTLGDRRIGIMPDNWTIITQDRKVAAHFEHTIAIRKGKAEILSSFEEVEHLERQNF